ncbi:MAG: hypothetical protein ACM34K_17530 [Bacillota bacterium]
MKKYQNIERMHKVWKDLNKSNTLMEVWNDTTEKLVKTYDIDCTLFYKDRVEEGYATELELKRLAHRINVKEENLLDFLTEEYHKIFFSLAEKIQLSEEETI